MTEGSKTQSVIRRKLRGIEAVPSKNLKEKIKQIACKTARIAKIKGLEPVSTKV